MNFGDLQNMVLARGRQRGVNFGGNPGNSATDFSPPYMIALALNHGYSEFLSRTNIAPIAALRVYTPSQASWFVNLNPIPANGNTVNPAAMRVYEMTYTPLNAQEYYVPIISTDRFRRYTGGYVRRLGSGAQIPRYASQQFGSRRIDVFPGMVSASDTIKFTVCPDPINSPLTCPASNGGQLQNVADVPLIPGQFHMALVEFALAQICDAANKQTQHDKAMAAFDKYVDSALEFAASYGEGDAEQRVVDSWITPEMVI